MQQARNRRTRVAFSRQIVRSDVHSLQIEDKKKTYAEDAISGSKEARMLEWNAGLKPITSRADALLWLIRAGGIGLIFIFDL